MKKDFTENEILELASEFKKRRSYLGISQLKLSKIAGISQSIINKFENGKIDPNYSTILKIERALMEQESISTNMRANDIMISEDEIVFLKPTCIICDVIDFIRKFDFSQFIVKDKNGNLVGTIYEKSIFDAISKKQDIYTTTIAGFIEPLPIIIPPEYKISDLSYIFSNKRTKFVLVGKNNKILGLITKSDLFKHNN